MTPSAEPIRALYVHVPFCRRKCRYCDFYSEPVEDALADRYLAAVLTELQPGKALLARPLSSIFLGGGTPNALGPDRLRQLLAGLAPYVAEATEFSIELNPVAVDDELAEILIAAGVNRVNVGVQSFRNNDLKLLGRLHAAEQALSSVAILDQAGLDNLGLDLIYGLPGQTLDTWREGLTQALGLPIAHLSCYALSFEPGTGLWNDRRDGRVQEMPDHQQRPCYDLAVELAEAAGLRRYEISNFARPGRQCRHNLTYWRNQRYLGVGPAAASYVDGRRSTNDPDLRTWLAAIEAGRRPPGRTERLTGREAIAETLMLGLRLLEGVDRPALARRFGLDPVDALPESFGRYGRQGLIRICDDRIRVAPDAFFVIDTILADMLAEAHAHPSSQTPPHP